MPSPRLRLADPARLAEEFEAIRQQAEVNATFPPEVVAEAEAVLARGGATGPPSGHDRSLLDVPFVTIDPPGARDLDQALHLEARGAGWRVRYAIADVEHWVAPGGAIDREALARGSTAYAPDAKAPLHPPLLSEGAASLLPDGERPAVVWTIDLDAEGEVLTTDLRRALVRSRAQLDYAGAQRELDAGRGGPVLEALRSVGALREERERARGGVRLELPDQEVEPVAGGGYVLRLREPLPIEGHNAQLSLLAGLEAARIMLAGGTGLLRTQAAPGPQDVEHLRRAVAGLGVPWPTTVPYPEWVRTLDPGRPVHAAALHEAAGLGRGASYLPFAGGSPPASDARHFAVAAAYAHVTAPLRRLADRHTTACCLAHAAGVPVPAWVLEALPGLPDAMRAGDRRARAVEREVLDLLEAIVLEGRVGEHFAAVIIDAEDDGRAGMIALTDPAVIARVAGPGLVAGVAATVVLTEADPARRRVRFALA